MSIDAVKIETTIAQPFVVAGTPFSLTTTVTNAHEDSIEIIQYVYHIPYQVQWINDVDFATEFGKFQETSFVRRLFSRSPWTKATQAPGTPMTFGSMEEPGGVLQTVLSGESTSYSFKAIVPKWLLVANAILTFQGRVTYKYKDAMHSSTFEISFPFRAPLRANVVGALTGSVLGALAQTLRDKEGIVLNPMYLSPIALAMIIAVIAVVFSSRRTKDVQPIFTVEDFWGGILVGFLLGYFGHEFFGSIVPIEQVQL